MLVRLVAVDLDGTLLKSDGNISNKDRSALQSAHECGIHIVIATGQSFKRANRSLLSLGIPYHLISSNGAFLISRDEDFCVKSCMTSENVQIILNYMVRPGLKAVITYSDFSEATAFYDSTRKRLCLARRKEFDVGSIPSSRKDALQVTIAGSNLEISGGLKRLGHIGFLKRIAFSFSPDRSIIDIGDLGATKGAALATLCAHIGIKRDSVVAIGDGYNDLDMLLFAKYPFLVENAPLSLRRKGLTITLSNEQDGVAHAIQSLLH